MIFLKSNIVTCVPNIAVALQPHLKMFMENLAKLVKDEILIVINPL